MTGPTVIILKEPLMFNTDRTKTGIAAICALLFVTACAPMPGAIAPIAPGGDYTPLTCGQARLNRDAIQTELDAMKRVQVVVAMTDAAGVYAFGYVPSKIIGGDKAGEIGGSKGIVDALNARLMACT